MFCYIRNFLNPKVHNFTHLNHFSLLALASQTIVASLQKKQMIICDKQFYIKYLFPRWCSIIFWTIFLRFYNVFFGGLDCSSGPVYFKSGHSARLQGAHNTSNPDGWIHPKCKCIINIYLRQVFFHSKWTVQELI